MSPRCEGDFSCGLVDTVGRSVFALADVQLDVSFFLVFVFLGVLQPLDLTDSSVVAQSVALGERQLIK